MCCQRGERSFVKNYYFSRKSPWYQGTCFLDGPRKFSAICSSIAMYVNDLRNNETVIVHTPSHLKAVTSEKLGTGYTHLHASSYTMRVLYY